MSQKEQIKWNRLLGLFELERQDILRIFYYSLFAGAVSLSLPLGVQAIINLIQGAQVSTSWIVLMVLVMMGLGFAGTLQIMQMRIINQFFDFSIGLVNILWITRKCAPAERPNTATE